MHREPPGGSNCSKSSISSSLSLVSSGLGIISSFLGSVSGILSIVSSLLGSLHSNIKSIDLSIDGRNVSKNAGNLTIDGLNLTIDGRDGLLSDFETCRELTELSIEISDSLLGGVCFLSISLEVIKLFLGSKSLNRSLDVLNLGVDTFH